MRAGLREVRLFTDRFECIATHPRATQPGQRFTHPEHLPAAQAQALTCTRATCQAQAEANGPATQQVIAELLASRPVDRFRTALRVLRLAAHFTPAQLEQACAFGLAHSDTGYATLKHWLQVETTRPPAEPPQETLLFARTPTELAEAILGGATWN